MSKTQSKSTPSTKHSRILMVVPTLGDRPELLRLTLESVTSQGSIKPDIVMIFPLKKAAIRKMAKEFNAVMIDDPGGLSSAVNAGIAEAKPWHDYIGWIGDDDLVAPGSLKAGIDALDKNPKAVVAYGYCDYIDLKGNRILTSKAGRFAPWLMTWGPNLMPCPGTVWRHSALQKAGQFDESNKYSMDLDMFLRLRKIGPFINTKRTMASFRWHLTSTTVSNRKKVLKETEIVKRNHLPIYLKPLSYVWDIPVRYATILAAKQTTKKAAKNFQ